MKGYLFSILFCFVAHTSVNALHNVFENYGGFVSDSDRKNLESKIKDDLLC